MILKKIYIFKKQILKKILHTKNHVLVQFTPKIRKFCVLRAYVKSMILKKKVFLKSTILKKKKLKSTILNKIFL